MNYVDLQRTDGRCESVYVGPIYQDADKAYRAAIDNANETVANVSWYHNIPGHQEHVGTRIFRPLN
jgi:hypothetical protein